MSGHLIYFSLMDVAIDRPGGQWLYNKPYPYLLGVQVSECISHYCFTHANQLTQTEQKLF